jgi:flagellin
LAANQASMNTSLQRLSTGLRINSAADDPAGLIASQKLKSEMVALNSAISNSTRASNLIGTAEGSLDEINTQLLNIQGLIDTAANSGGMTANEVTANQMQIDEALSSIDRIASTSEFNGKKLLDGTLGYGTSGITAADIASGSIQVNQAVFNGASKSVAYDVDSTTAAQGELQIVTADRALITAGTIRVQGNLGTADVTVTAAMSQANLIAAVNAVTAQTGVTAAADGTTATTTDFTSTDASGTATYGTSKFVRITPLSATVFTTSDANAGTDPTSSAGTDATVNSVDGNTTGISVDGLNVTVNQTGLNLSFSITDNTVTATGTFNVLQGGAKFQIGAQINTNNQVAIGIQNMDSGSLGDATNGYLNTLKSGGVNALSSGNFTAAATIASNAIDQVSTVRGRLGALQTSTLGSQIRSLGSTLENITTAESTITDTDFAAETANMTRAQILVQAGTSVLAAANSAPQAVLSLLKNM